MNDPDYLAKPRPIHAPFDMDDALKHLNTYMDIQNFGKIRRFWTWLNDMKLYERGRHRSQLQASMLLQKLFQYPDTWEFVSKMDTEEDFHINHSVVNMHIWLVVTRLRDFTKNKFAEELAQNLIDVYNAYTTDEIFNLDVLRKGKKVDDIENYLHSI